MNPFLSSRLPECVDEERGEDRARHHDDRLLAGRLEREQEKVLRWGSKSSIDFLKKNFFLLLVTQLLLSHESWLNKSSIGTTAGLFYHLFFKQY